MPDKPERKYTVMLIVLAAVLLYIAARYSGVFAGLISAPAAAGDRLIAVYIEGAVAAPDYYELPAGSRLHDLLALCPLLEEADTDGLNPARYLVDGEAIYVPYLSAAVGDGTEEASSAGKVNINTADMEELMSLPQIGETRARAIIAYRENHGPFSHIGEIMKISGISAAIYRGLRELICVE